jgi:hypothetical protein
LPEGGLSFLHAKIHQMFLDFWIPFVYNKKIVVVPLFSAIRPGCPARAGSGTVKIRFRSPAKKGTGSFKNTV